jgi:hypothetical protein
MKLIHHEDGAHGWVEFSVNDLSKYGLSLKDFSSYSYIDKEKDLIYLEEDCDAGIIIDALKSKNITFTIQSVFTKHQGQPSYNPIRRLPQLGDE